MQVLAVDFIALQQTGAITFPWQNQAQAVCRLKNQFN